MRKIKFLNGEYYHVYNRGVDKRNIFMDEKDYLRFLISMKEFNVLYPVESLYRLNQIRNNKRFTDIQANRRGSASIVKIICYNILPNHYHFLLQQLNDNGIQKFIQKIGTGYTMYFNKKYNRTGVLFQGKFKAIHVKKDSYLLWLACYINGNSEIHKIEKAENYKWSSYPDYLGKRDEKLSDKNIVLKDFKTIKEYQNLVNRIINDSKQIKEDKKKYLIE